MKTVVVVAVLGVVVLGTVVEAAGAVVTGAAGATVVGVVTVVTESGTRRWTAGRSSVPGRLCWSVNSEIHAAMKTTTTAADSTPRVNRRHP